MVTSSVERKKAWEGQGRAAVLFKQTMEASPGRWFSGKELEEVRQGGSRVCGRRLFQAERTGWAKTLKGTRVWWV